MRVAVCTSITVFQLLHEIELREPRFNDVHNKGAALLNQGHPAIHVIEFYLNAMQNKWDWLLALSKCLEQHLRDARNLHSVHFLVDDLLHGVACCRLSMVIFREITEMDAL